MDYILDAHDISNNYFKSQTESRFSFEFRESTLTDPGSFK